MPPPSVSVFFFFNDTAPTEIYPLPLHDALPISAAISSEPRRSHDHDSAAAPHEARARRTRASCGAAALRSEEHTSELQSPDHLVCRLLLEKKKKKQKRSHTQGTIPSKRARPSTP